MTQIQQKSGSAYATSLVITPAAATTAGSCLVLQVQHQGLTSVTVSDSAGGTWVKAGSTADLSTPATGQRLMTTYYRLGAGSVTSVTITAASQAALAANLQEHSGVTGLRAVSVANITSGSVTSPVADLAGDLVVSSAGWGATSRAEAVSSGYTTNDPASVGTSGTITYFASAYRPAAAGGTEGPTWTAISATVGVITVAFTTTASPGGHYYNNFRGGTAGATLTLGSSGNTGGASGDFFDGLNANAWVYATLGGSLAAKAAAPQGQAALRKQLPTLDTKIQVIEVFTAGATPTAELQTTQVSWGTAVGVDTASSFTLCRETDNKAKLRKIGTAGSSTTAWDSTATLVPGTKYRRVVWADMATGRAHAAIYPDGSATPVSGMDSGVLGTTTPLDLGPTSGAGFTNVRSGKYDGNAYPGDVILHSVDIYYGNAAADDNGLAKVTGAAVPTVTLDKATGPVPRSDGTGGTEVTATVDWQGGNGGSKVYGVDWGDNTPITNPLVSGATFKHMYTTPGTYQVTPYADNA